MNIFTLTSSFKTYMYSVCRNLWLQKLNKRKAIFDKLTDVEEYIDLPKDMLQEAGLEQVEMYRIIQIHFLSLQEDCQKVLRLFTRNIPLRDIVVTMGFKTEKYAKTRKYLCKEELKKRIANDPRSHRIIKDEN